MVDYAGFCTECGVKVVSFEGLEGCPNCGTKSLPCNMDEQVTISINWHELHILCVWAEQWGHKAVGKPGTIYSIVQRIMDQFPGQNKRPLTLARELNDLKDNPPDGIGGIETDFPGVG